MPPLDDDDDDDDDDDELEDAVPDEPVPVGFVVGVEDVSDTVRSVSIPTIDAHAGATTIPASIVIEAVVKWRTSEA